MAPKITPPPERTSQATWPNGEPRTVRDAYDAKTATTVVTKAV
jgi:hypothetical protein